MLLCVKQISFLQKQNQSSLTYSSTPCISLKQTLLWQNWNCFSPWSFKQYPIMPMYVCMPTPFNSLQCTWCLGETIITSSQPKAFFDQFAQSYNVENINPTHHLQVKSWKNSSFLQSTQSSNTFIFYELFHNSQHFCWNVTTPHTNCDANFQKFFILLQFLFAFISCKNFKKTHDS